MRRAKVFTANILASHLDLLQEADRRADSDCELGTPFIFSAVGEYSYELIPVFCETRAAALELQESYRRLLASAEDVSDLGVDSLVLLPRE